MAVDERQEPSTRAQAAGARAEALREALIAAAAEIVRDGGLAALKARPLAEAVGCSVGAIYNVVADLDGLVLALNARTLAELDAALAGAEAGPPPATAQAATRRLEALAAAYLAFARARFPLWRAVFDHRLPAGAEVPAWYREAQAPLFARLTRPLAVLMAGAPAGEVAEKARSLFSAVHGVVLLGLEEKLGPLPPAVLEAEVAALVRALAASFAHAGPGVREL